MNEAQKETLARLTDCVLDGPGDLDPAARKAIASRSGQLARARDDSSAAVPEAFRPLVDKVALHAYKTTDRDIETLREAGHSEDAIFEAIVSAAVGAGRVRFEAGMAALRGEV